jgi:hypothetical protein
MPIRHVLSRKRSPVIAMKSEIDVWVKSRDSGDVNYSPGSLFSLTSTLRASLRVQQQLVRKIAQSRNELSSTRAALKQTMSKIAKSNPTNAS